MAIIELDFEVGNSDVFARLAGRLDAAGSGMLRRKLTRGIEEASQPALNAVKRAFMGVDFEGHAGPGTGIHARVADATDLSSLSDGVSIAVHPEETGYGGYAETLVNGLNGTAWRHPYFGHKPWFGQVGDEVFYSTLRTYEPAWRRGCEHAMREVADYIRG